MANLLPPGPWKLRSGYLFKRHFFAVLLLLAGIGIGGAYGVWQWEEAARILADGRVWDDPKAIETGADVDGKVTTRKFIFNSYDLKVTFDDENEQVHHDVLEFSTVWSTVDQEQSPVVRYLPGAPDKFALNWATGVSGGRWASFALMFGIGVLIFGFGLIGFAYATWNGTRRVAAAASRGVEVECPILGVAKQVVNGKESGNLLYRYKVPEHLGVPPGFELTEIVNPKKGLPVLLDKDTKLLVIVSTDAPKHPVVLRADLSPLDVEEGLRLQVSEQVARRA
ncbi:MAG: hypothetical protein IT381_11180 [Deltaproteobacteria bacterium]|nr:hypothetical protein [Deltaproteobacteria bacterium]